MPKLRTANLLGALAGGVMERLARQGRSHHSETSSSVAALNVIGFDEGCSNGELSHALGLSHTATVRLVDKLEAEGLVTSREGSDRRFVALHLTEAGAERAKSVVHQRCLLLGDLIDVLSAEQRDQFDTILDTMLRSLAVRTGAAGHVCRLCDFEACPPEICPVHQEELARESGRGEYAGLDPAIG